MGMNRFGISAILLILAMLPAQRAVADILGGALDYLVGEVLERTRLQGTTVTVTANDMFDVGTGQNLPLSELLRDKVVAALEKQNVAVRGAAPEGGSQWVLQVQWKVRQDDLHITLLALLRPQTGNARLVSRSSKIPLDAVELDLLIPDFTSYARTLVHRLEQAAHYRNVRSIDLRPIEPANGALVEDAAQYFAQWLGSALEQSSLLRRVRAKASDEAGPPQADAEIVARVSVTGNQVTVTAELREPDEKTINRQLVQFDSDLLPPTVAAGLVQQQAPRVASRRSGFSKNGLTVELAAGSGDSSNPYRRGSAIRFVVRINRDAFLYLFNFNPEGKTFALYPDPDTEPKKLKAGSPIRIPDDGADYMFEVQPPFGTEMLLAVAAEEPLNVPRDMSGEWSRADAVPGLLREMGENAAGGYAEARLELITTR